LLKINLHPSAAGRLGRGGGRERERERRGRREDRDMDGKISIYI
jgi:hypothetical protein